MTKNIRRGHVMKRSRRIGWRRSGGARTFCGIPSLDRLRTIDQAARRTVRVGVHLLDSTNCIPEMRGLPSRWYPKETTLSGRLPARITMEHSSTTKKCGRTQRCWSGFSGTTTSTTGCRPGGKLSLGTPRLRESEEGPWSATSGSPSLSSKKI